MGSGERIRVGIVFGGQSAEHEISILSARNVLEALDRSRFEPVLIGIDKSGRWLVQNERRLLSAARDPRQVGIDAGAPVQMPATLGAQWSGTVQGAGRVDVIFPLLHGTFGEDGAVQGLFEMAGVPYVGAGVLGSAIGMDKDVMKRLLRETGIPITEFRMVRGEHFEADPRRVCAALAPLGLPVFTKPANAGSSVGVRRVSAAAELEDALRYALQFDVKALVEAAVSGREIELAVLGGEPPSVSVPGEVIVQHADGFYSYEAKYLDEHGARLQIPAPLEPAQCACAQALALRAFEVLECEGMARVDMFLRPDGTLLVNEINTLPGFTAISMYPKLWALSGINPTELVTRLIELALQRARRRQTVRRSAR